MDEQELFRQLGALFAKNGHQLFLVGGSVRDRILDRESKDLDFTTDATPDETHAMLAIWADSVWDIGREFGTIAAKKDGHDVEITTFRADGPGRKPEVVFTGSLEDDLARRDFTMNAIALEVTAEGLADEFVDPFDGFNHIIANELRTPRTTVESFSDDPLRMLRAARFAAQLGMEASLAIHLSMIELAPRLDEISRERIAAEMDKLLMSAMPEDGLALLESTQLLPRFLPGVHARDFQNWREDDDIRVRWARLLSNVKSDVALHLLKDLKTSTERAVDVASLVGLAAKFGGGDDEEPWVIRKLVHEAGALLEPLLVLLDDELLDRAVRGLLEAEGAPRLPFNGKEIMAVLGVKPGPIVGQAQAFLWECVMAGPLTQSDAFDALKIWQANL